MIFTFIANIYFEKIDRWDSLQHDFTGDGQERLESFVYRRAVKSFSKHISGSYIILLCRFLIIIF